MATFTNILSQIGSEPLFWALVGGILPAVFWLWFWLHEDATRPEPTGLIMISFIAGMAAVAVVFPLEKFAYGIFHAGTPLLLSWSAIEEIIKYSAISLVALHSKQFDEPVDALVYMTTVALGFAAMENALFILGPLQHGDAWGSFLTGNLRFMGATLLHTVTSGFVGVMIGLSFYKGWFTKFTATIFGLAVAIGLHTLFNFFIIRDKGADTFTVLLWLWGGAALFIILFEVVKRVQKPIL